MCFQLAVRYRIGRKISGVVRKLTGLPPRDTIRAFRAPVLARKLFRIEATITQERKCGKVRMV